jgi:hypothetical protein
VQTCLRWAFIFSTLLWGAMSARSHGASDGVQNPTRHQQLLIRGRG